MYQTRYWHLAPQLTTQADRRCIARFESVQGMRGKVVLLGHFINKRRPKISVGIGLPYFEALYSRFSDDKLFARPHTDALASFDVPQSEPASTYSVDDDDFSLDILNCFPVLASMRP
jgi:hypothetical protein